MKTQKISQILAVNTVAVGIQLPEHLRGTVMYDIRGKRQDCIITGCPGSGIEGMKRG